jgi:D-lactate dehydrogenase (cytochrome)
MGVAAVREEGDFLIQSRYQSYLSDESGLGPGTASILFLPNDEAQIAAFLREMNERRMPVTVSGGRTGIVGGAVPQGGSVLSLESMKRIVGIRWDNESQEWRMTVQPGITLRELQQRIATKNFEENTNESWKDLPRFLKDSNQYFYPPDPTEDLASLGGTVATDASGARTYFYGRTREHIRNIRVVLTNGEVIPLRRGEHQASRAEVIHVRHLDGTVTDIPLPKYERPKVKCATGFYNSTNMDLIDIFIGSEGTLGVITEIEIALQIKPKTAMFLAFFPSMEDATAFVIEERSKKKDKGPLSIHSMEYIDKNSLGLIHEIKEDHKLGIRLPESPTASILCEFGYADIEPAIQQLIESLSKFHSSADNAISGIDEGDKNRLKALRHAVPESINRMIAKRKKDIPGLHKLGTDTAVPDDKLLELMKLYNQKLIESRLEHYVVGHLAENHLHVNILPTSQEELIDGERLVRDLAKSAVALGGAVSAEHGIGKMKREFMMLMYSDAEVGEMIRLKRALDPNWILSRGNLFAPL